LRAAFAQVHLQHLLIHDLRQVDGGFVLLANVAKHQTCVPSERVNLRNSSVSFKVSAPGLPLPIGRPSSEATGTISAAVPVRKHSSAVMMSYRVRFTSRTGANSIMTPRVMPMSAPAETGGVSNL